MSIPATKETTVLRSGMRGEPVLGLQQALKDLGFDPGDLDSTFSEKTESAVRAFQAREDLETTGVFDDDTRRVFAAAVAVHGIARQTVLSLVPSDDRLAIAAAVAGADAGAEKVLKGTVVQESDVAPVSTPFWKEPWFFLVAGGVVAVGTAFMLRSRAAAVVEDRALLARPRRPRRPKLTGAFGDFEDRDTVSELAAVLEDGEETDLDDIGIDDGVPESQMQILNGPDDGEAGEKPKRRRKKAKEAA